MSLDSDFQCLEYHTALVFKVMQFDSEDGGSTVFETSGTIDPVTECHILEDLTFQTNI